MPRVARSYLVCATPRSGSTLLCEMLRATGAAGCPLEHFEVLRHSGRPRQPREYFDGVADPEVLEALPPLEQPRPVPESARRWWGRILRDGSTPNGVWGGKLMWGHVVEVVARARELDTMAGTGLDPALRLLLPDARLVHVTRADKVAQAVSLWTAVQTQAWRGGDGDGSGAGAGTGAGPAAPEPRYVYAGIEHLLQQLENHDAAWRRWFAGHGHEPIEVAYEQLGADPRGTVAEVLRTLGLPDAGVPEPPLRRQADERSQEWAERFRAERARRGGEVPARPRGDVRWHAASLERDERWGLLGVSGATVWLTGLPSSGKSTLAVELERRLVELGQPAYRLDGDNVRHGLSGDLGFSDADRSEHIRRVGEVARLFADAGQVAVVAAISPCAADRARVRQLHEEAGLEFVEVHVDASVEECARRDPKGLYGQARTGRLQGFTGVDAPYEAPAHAEVHVPTAELSVEESVDRILQRIRAVTAVRA